MSSYTIAVSDAKRRGGGAARRKEKLRAIIRVYYTTKDGIIPLLGNEMENVANGPC